MASAQEPFDAEEMRREVVTETGRSDFVYLADMCVEFNPGDVNKREILESIIAAYQKRGDYSDVHVAKYYVELEEILSNSGGEECLRMEILLDIAGIYFNASHYRHSKAIEYAQRAEKIAHELKEKSGKAKCCDILGSAHLKLAEYKEAIDCFNKGLAISTEVGDRSGIAKNNGHLGDAYRCLGQYEKAIYYCNKGLEISTEIGDRSGIASNNGNLGTVYLSLGQYEKAIDYYNKSLEISTEIGDRSGIASNNGNLGTAYHCLGQYEKAIGYYNKSLEINTEIRDRSGIASNNGNLGTAYRCLGQYEKAIDYYNKGLEISTEIRDRSGIATNNGNLGTAYRCLGQYEKAIDYYNKGLEINTEIADRSGIASDNGNLGNAYHGFGQYEKAIDYNNKGLEISTEIGDRSGIACSNGNLGNAYSSLGQLEKAIDYYNKGLEISTEIGDPSGVATNNLNLGKLYHTMGQYKKSMKCYEKSFKISVEIGDRGLEWISLGNIGVHYWSLYLSVGHETEDVSNLQKAASFLKRSVMCSDEILSDLDIDRNKISFNIGYFERYAILMHCFIFLNRIEAALLVIDLGKAKALHACIEKRKKSEIDDMVNNTRETWQNIDKNEEKLEIDNIEKGILLKKNDSTLLFYSFDFLKFLHIWVINGVDDIKHIVLERSNDLTLPENSIFDILKMLLQTFSVNLNRDSSLFKLASNSTSGRHKIAEIPWGQMLVNEKFIDFNKRSENCELENSDNILSRKTQSFESIFLPNTRDESESKIKNVLQVVQRYDLAVDVAKLRSPIRPPSMKQHDHLLHELFQKLISPVKNFIKGNKLIIVPDKFLFFVPFCALKDENGSSISQHYSIQITPSLHTLYASMKQSNQPSLGFALFVGNPTVGKVSFCAEEIEPGSLPFATAEAKCLAALFDAKPLVEDKAIKQAVLQLIQNAGIIHIAAHGDRNRGEIALAPNPNSTRQGLPNEESYLLREENITEIHISARLVVLCCCHTGRGNVSSEGVVGLARAFLAAGARCVLATLWPIHDEGTKLFMENFYNEICNGTSVCEALRTTMNIFQQPHHLFSRKLQVWAPFTIYGEDVKFSKHDIEEIKSKSREMNL